MEQACCAVTQPIQNNTVFEPGGGGALQYQMDMGVRLTLPKAGAFGENTVSKNEGSLGEKPNLGLKLGGIE